MYNPAYRAPFPRTQLSMHIQYICECWNDPRRLNDTQVGARVDAARLMLRHALAVGFDSQRINRNVMKGCRK